ncbi:hypothetical protein V5799_016790 [Amblyomma americanum]|uniref:Uncharacterized protein n=1 Tax=Amblyomma americanum TaxID=6943 RepID=A0AAQ4F445_AMBAM
MEDQVASFKDGHLLIAGNTNKLRQKETVVYLSSAATCAVVDVYPGVQGAVGNKWHGKQSASLWRRADCRLQESRIPANTPDDQGCSAVS